jgi:rare lipoprotein A (peptidoglycan hydrolase)
MKSFIVFFGNTPSLLKIVTINIIGMIKKNAAVFLAILLASCSRYEEPRIKYWHAGSERPYVINGVRYFPQVHYRYSEIGYASWYGYDCHGRPTATGRTFNKNSLTGAHRTLPLPCVVLVENLENGKKIKLLINDRGPFAKTNKRIIDVTQRAADILGFRLRGSAKVRVTCLPRESVKAAMKYKRKPYIPSLK